MMMVPKVISAAKGGPNIRKKTLSSMGLIIAASVMLLKDTAAMRQTIPIAIETKPGRKQILPSLSG
jgi:ribosomal protein L30/L7E